MADKAIVRKSTGMVVTILRGDSPLWPYYTPPPGCHVTDADKLPPGWTREPAELEPTTDLAARLAKVEEALELTTQKATP